MEPHALDRLLPEHIHHITPPPIQLRAQQLEIILPYHLRKCDLHLQIHQVNANTRSRTKLEWLERILIIAKSFIKPTLRPKVSESRQERLSRETVRPTQESLLEP